MKAIILAAGVGSRLRPITDQKPKTMVEVNGKPMLGYILESIWKANVEEVVICTGYRENVIIDYCEKHYPGKKIFFVSNPDFESTNNMYSLYLARQYMTEAFLLMNADLVFDEGIIANLVKEKHTCVAVDKGHYFEESMKVSVFADGSISGISKKISRENAFGSSIDVYLIQKKDINAILSGLLTFIETQEDRRQWTEVLLNMLFENKIVAAIPHCIGNSKWFEIDNFEDLAKAEKLFNQSINRILGKKVFFLDRDGTIALEDEAIPGAIEFIDLLKTKEKKVFLLTNNSSKTPTEHARLLEHFGFSFSESEILVSTDSCLAEMRELGFIRLYWSANESVSRYISECGFIFDDKDPQAVVLTYNDEIDYSGLVSICKHLRKGIPYYATHIDMVCPTKEGVVPDIGCIIQVIKETTGRAPIKTFGKPAKGMINSVLRKNKLQYDDAVVIGDRLYTDIELACETEMISVLVLSGETNRSAYEDATIKANVVIQSIADLLPGDR